MQIGCSLVFTTTKPSPLSCWVSRLPSHTQCFYSFLGKEVLLPSLQVGRMGPESRCGQVTSLRCTALDHVRRGADAFLRMHHKRCTAKGLVLSDRSQDCAGMGKEVLRSASSHVSVNVCCSRRSGLSDAGNMKDSTNSRGIMLPSCGWCRQDYESKLGYHGSLGWALTHGGTSHARQ